MSGRFLVVSASMGSGHDAVSAELTRRLEASGNTVARADLLDLLPGGLGGALRASYRTVIRRAPALYAGVYAAFFRSGHGPRPGSTPLAALAAEQFVGLVARERPDAVVPAFHLAAQLTGRLRTRGTLGVPSAVLLTDFAVHRQWLHPGNDLYLCLTPGIARQVNRALARPAVVSGALVGPRFVGPTGTPAERDRLAGPQVLISAGAWGAGTHMARTARLVQAAGYRPVVLCGRNDGLRRELSRTPGVVAVGWMSDMPGLMRNSRVLVDNAAGQTALEALAVGLPVVGYRPIPGHGAEGVRRMAECGFTDHARDSWTLIQALDTLSRSGPVRERRIAAARELFSADAVSPLEALARTSDGRSSRAYGGA